MRVRVHGIWILIMSQLMHCDLVIGSLNINIVKVLYSFGVSQKQYSGKTVDNVDNSE